MPHFLVALWLAFLRFLAALFRSSSSPALPAPVTASYPRPSITRAASLMLPHPLKRSPSLELFHPPQVPFPRISVSGIFAVLAASPQSLPPPPDDGPPPQPDTPSHVSHPASPPSFHTLCSSSPSSAVIVELDRSALIPTTMSDGSLQVISLGDPPASSSLSEPDIARLPSPWSGSHIHAATFDPAHSMEDSAALQAILLSPMTKSNFSSTVLSSPLNTLDMSVLVDVADTPSRKANAEDTHVPKVDRVCDENGPTLAVQDPQTPLPRRQTISCAVHSRALVSTKRFSCPVGMLNAIKTNHVRSATSISPMAYELRLGLFDNGRNKAAIESIISLLDSANPQSVLPHISTTQSAVAG